jgi:hypothetical protein
MKNLKNALPLQKQALKKIMGGLSVNDQNYLAVKCNRLCSISIPCNKGCTCAGNRCIEDDIIAVD